MFPNKCFLDVFLIHLDSCPKAKIVQSSFYNSEVVINLEKQYNSTLSKVSKFYKNKSELQKIFDALIARKCHNFDASFNGMLTEKDFEDILALANKEFKEYYDSANIGKYHIAFFLDELKELFLKSFNKPEDISILLAL